MGEVNKDVQDRQDDRTNPTGSDVSGLSLLNSPDEIGELEWSAHLARGHPWKAATATGAAVMAGGLALAVLGNPLLAVGAGAVVIGSVSEFLFPVRHRLTVRGAEVRSAFSASSISWSQVRKCYLLPDGVKLSPLETPSRLEVFRGVFLRFADNQDEVLEFVRQARDAAGHGIHA